MKIRSVGAELLCADGQANKQKDRHDKANSHFSNFSNGRLVLAS